MFFRRGRAFILLLKACQSFRVKKMCYFWVESEAFLMIRIFLIVLATSLSLGLTGQEPPMPEISGRDTLPFPVPAQNLYGLVMPLPESGVSFSALTFEEPSFPVFDFRNSLQKGWLTGYPSGWEGRSRYGLFGGTGLFFSPYGWSGELFHQATYQVSDKLLLHGSSYGFTPLLLPALPGTKPPNLRGASLYLEYKVSKNFRIETGISVPGTPIHFNPRLC